MVGDGAVSRWHRRRRSDDSGCWTASLLAVVVCGLAAGLVAATTPAAQTSALTDLYTSTGRGLDWWTTWSTSSDPCGSAWYGLTCAGGNVTYVLGLWAHSLV